MSRASLLRQLEALRAHIERQDEEQQLPDWDALGRGDWPAFINSLGPPPAPDPETLAHRDHLDAVCAELDCTPLELGLLECPADIGIVRHHAEAQTDPDSDAN